MTQVPDKEDEQWLNALAGRSDPAADGVVNQQAEALRRALQAQRAKLEESVPQADDTQYQQFLFRLKREGLLKDLEIAEIPSDRHREAASPWRSMREPPKAVDSRATLATTKTGMFKVPIFPKTQRPWNNPMLWGLAATLVIGVGVVVQMGGLYPGQDDAETLRGGGKATVLVVDNPEVRLVELLAGLKAAGVEPVVKRETGGRILVTVKSSDKVLDYLREQRIEPTVVDGMVTLLLQTSGR